MQTGHRQVATTFANLLLVMRPRPDFIHEFIPGSLERTLLLLHGTGGNERDLIPLGRELD